MDACKEVLEKASKEGKYVDRLQLFTRKEGGGTQSTGPHEVTLLGAEGVTGIDYQTKEERPEMRLLLDEEGVKKTYQFAMYGKKGMVHYLISRFAPIKKGTRIVLEGKKSGKASYVDVQIVDGQDNTSEIKVGDIPIIEADENFDGNTPLREFSTDS